jgi:adenylate cyclase class 2
MANYEVEKKYRVNDDHAAFSIIKSLTQKKETELQTDIVFLYMSDSFKNFKPGDPVMRIRKSSAGCVLTMKKQVNAESNLEIETIISDFESMCKILREIGFQEVVSVVKQRSVYQYEDAEICVDVVEGLGYFIEIEIMCSEEEQGAAIQRINDIAKELSLNEDQVETQKYDFLLTRSKGLSK